jgi:hypothetical protein
MHATSLQRIDKLKSTKISLRQDIERDIELLVNLQIVLEESSLGVSHDLQGRVEVLEGTLKLNIANEDKFLFELSIEEKMERHHGNMLESYKLEKLEMECNFDRSKSSFDEISSSASCLDKVLVNMREQLACMQDGIGVTNYPRPVADDPSVLVQRTCCCCCCWFNSHSNNLRCSCSHVNALSSDFTSTFFTEMLSWSTLIPLQPTVCTNAWENRNKYATLVVMVVMEEANHR